MISRVHRFSRYMIAVVCCLLMTTLLARAQGGAGSTQLISTPFRLSTNVTLTGGTSPSLSPDGGFVAYIGGSGRIFLRDRNQQTPEPVSVTFDTNMISNGICRSASVSQGRGGVAFES